MHCLFSITNSMAYRTQSFRVALNVCVLARETFLIEDLRMQMLLQHTPAYEELLRELQGKRDSIEESFYITDAMSTGNGRKRNMS